MDKKSCGSSLMEGLKEKRVGDQLESLGLRQRMQILRDGAIGSSEETEGSVLAARTAKQYDFITGLFTEVLKEVSQIVKQLKLLREEVKQRAVDIVPPPGQDLSSALEAMEVRLRTYAVCAQEAHRVAFDDREREYSAREARNCNLRVVGLLESDGEDTMAAVVDFFRDTLRVQSLEVEHTVRVGKRESVGGVGTWKDADLVILVETWEIGENSLVELPNFTFVTSVQNWRKCERGRGFGGVAIWLRNGVDLTVTVDHKDPLKQFICLRVSMKLTGTIGFLFACYFAPAGALVYSRRGEESPFMALTEYISKVDGRGPVWVFGDFNSRIQTTQGENQSSPEDLSWRRQVEEEKWARVSEDVGSNSFAPAFTQMLNTCELTVLNGTSGFPYTSGFTCYTRMGNSTVDFLLANTAGRDMVAQFRIGSRAPESDHSSLSCVLTGFDCKRSRTRTSAPRLLRGLDRSKKEVYERTLTDRLSTIGQDALLVSQVLIQTMREVLLRGANPDKVWYDAECHDARLKAMSSLPVDQEGAYRVYKNFVKAKKRAFLRSKQEELTRALYTEPRLFWKQFHTKQRVTELSVTDLKRYVEELYFFLNASRMPETEGPGCVFTSKEVERGWKAMAGGRAADFEGLTVETLRWGGPVLLDVMTELFNKACREGLPDSWVARKVVALYKSGSKTNPRSYRTIMIATIFAKVLGRLLENRLSDWCEETGVRALAQADFRREHSVLDHALTLRVIMEEAKHVRKPLFLLFVDFRRAFDSVSRGKLWDRLNSLGVPSDLVRSISLLYHTVRAKISSSDDGIGKN
ncbi:hypothetical protein R1sor_007335 [Riccia sorocarpa]|uniref:Reverse transcriptase domain-containing protein n=1 Tax=Riccia sorocarpa TaxID=122646 RepID=A0ABD3HSU0_9MARC